MKFVWGMFAYSLFKKVLVALAGVLAANQVPGVEINSQEGVITISAFALFEALRAILTHHEKSPLPKKIKELL